jgi:hypothetical protein
VTGERGASAGPVLLADLADRPTVHRIGIRQHVVQQHADAVEITLYGGWLSLEDLWRQIEWRSGKIGAHPIVIQRSARAKVHQDESTIVLLHDVVGFDVPMQEPSSVNCSERATNLDANGDYFRRWERSLLLEDLLERPTLHEFHPDTDPIADAISSKYSDNIGMTHPSEKPTFFDRERITAVSRGIGLPKEFQRDLSIEPCIPCAVHFTERPFTDPIEQAQRTPDLRCRCRRFCRSDL